MALNQEAGNEDVMGILSSLSEVVMKRTLEISKTLEQ
jgi:hypothetical protein